ncbi:VOC family protein [Tamlana haliotis]|uniref:VOC family protein n=1 Tax=Pseudotamlana haliotis TaxID=2614804 RepID=A0A6N6MFK5_9FLAO|nr:VOC family protein [Tamlana haliotis]KAB1067570.1 VOC family protein [Tamlana haliotis]
MRQNLNIITLGVSDLKKTLDFYERGLNWKKSKASKDKIAFFEMNGIVLSFFSKDALAKDANVSNIGSGFSGITIAYNAKSENEVDSVLRKVAELGAEIIKPAKKADWGGYSGYFKDIDGHIFEVAYNQHFEFDENDNIKM